jgi:cysteinyl-tRNA synthetase
MKFDPFAQWGKVFETWQKVTDDSIARTQAFYAEIEKAEAKRVERVESAIDEIVKLQKEGLAYTAQLGADFRKLSLEAFQKVASLATSSNAS